MNWSSGAMSRILRPRNERGSTSVEYAVLLAAVAAVLSLWGFFEVLQAVFSAQVVIVEN